MKSEKHWKEAENVDAFYTANQIALSMMEHAKTKGIDYRGIKVMSRKDAHYHGLRHVDSAIKWEDGPTGWAYLTDVYAANVLVEPTDGNTLTFYQM